MTQTVTALYDRYDDAVAAANDLERADIALADISIVASNADNRYSEKHPTMPPKTPGKAPVSGRSLAASAVCSPVSV